MGNSILVVDDEPDFLETARRGLVTSGFKNVRLESDSRKAAALFEQGGAVDIALIDITMPGMNGVELLEAIKSSSPSTECIMVTAINEAKVAVESLKKGAYDYLVKPISRDDLVLAINRALERKRLLDILDLSKKKSLPKLKHVEAFKPIVTRSADIFRVLKEAELHAASNVHVLITGESGTGKELLARAIHSASPRARFPFTPVNMASVTGSLFDAEFFGHTRGAFTGAEKDRVGYLEHTGQGTLFLDEIGTLPLDLQGKLLRVLQEGEYIKVGTSKTQKANVRFIAATNANLERLMAKGEFRKDLYYRLKGAWLHLPPLRERQEDIPLLIEKFLEEFCNAGGNRDIEKEAVSILMDYDYPGNIRELRSIVQSAVNLAQGKPMAVNFFPDHLRKRKATSRRDLQAGFEPIVSLAEAEKAHILRAYKETGKNKSRAAKLLGIGLNTLRRKLESYGAE
ncbi:MAG: sigma-54-dependent Fis family transcriptional regulator [Desulfobacterales bacterium]|nr:sigma-54-dependent Fis family transcriptional regulator [Desulfobacterales bacterium]